MTLYVHRPDMCFGHQYQCIACVWLLFIQQACLPYPDHGWPVCYPMGLGISGSTSKGLGPLRAHSANSFFGKKEILQGLCFEEMKVFHGFVSATKVKSLTAFTFGHVCCPCIVSQCGVWVCLGWATYQDPHMHNNASMGFSWGL